MATATTMTPTETTKASTPLITTVSMRIAMTVTETVSRNATTEKQSGGAARSRNQTRKSVLAAVALIGESGPVRQQRR